MHVIGRDDLMENASIHFGLDCIFKSNQKGKVKEKCVDSFWGMYHLFQKYSEGKDLWKMC